jgi:hypothetical protein
MFLSRGLQWRSPDNLLFRIERPILSAPEPDLETAKRRHKGPLIGIALAVVFASVLLVALLLWLGYLGNEPGNEAPQIDGRTGAEEQTDGS